MALLVISICKCKQSHYFLHPIKARKTHRRGRLCHRCNQQRDYALRLAALCHMARQFVWFILPRT